MALTEKQKEAIRMAIRCEGLPEGCGGLHPIAGVACAVIGLIGTIIGFSAMFNDDGLSSVNNDTDVNDDVEFDNTIKGFIDMNQSCFGFKSVEDLEEFLSEESLFSNET